MLDYLVRLAAEQGEGAILQAAQEMPTLKMAAALPDASAVLREARAWVREFGRVKEEAAKEAADLAGGLFVMGSMGFKGVDAEGCLWVG